MPPLITLCTLIVSLLTFAVCTKVNNTALDEATIAGICERLITGQDGIVFVGMSADRLVLITNVSSVFMVSPKALQSDSNSVDFGGRVSKDFSEIWPTLNGNARGPPIPSYSDYVPKFLISNHFHDYVYFFAANRTTNRADGILELTHTPPVFIPQTNTSQFDTRNKWLSSNKPFTVYSARWKGLNWVIRKHILSDAYGKFDFGKPMESSPNLYLCFTNALNRNVVISFSSCVYPVNWPITTGFIGSKNVYLFAANQRVVYRFETRALEEPEKYFSPVDRAGFSSFFDCDFPNHAIYSVRFVAIIVYILFLGALVVPCLWMCFTGHSQPNDTKNGSFLGRPKGKFYVIPPKFELTYSKKANKAGQRIAITNSSEEIPITETIKSDHKPTGKLHKPIQPPKTLTLKAEVHLEEDSIFKIPPKRAAKSKRVAISSV